MHIGEDLCRVTTQHRLMVDCCSVEVLALQLSRDSFDSPHACMLASEHCVIIKLGKEMFTSKYISEYSKRVHIHRQQLWQFMDRIYINFIKILPLILCVCPQLQIVNTNTCTVARRQLESPNVTYMYMLTTLHKGIWGCYVRADVVPMHVMCMTLSHALQLLLKLLFYIFYIRSYSCHWLYMQILCLPL